MNQSMGTLDCSKKRLIKSLLKDEHGISLIT